MKSKLINLLIKIKCLKPLAMARYAKENTDFYSEFYKDYSMDNFAELPVFTKYSLKGVSPYKLLSRELRNKIFLYGETSGSSGSPTPSFWTRQDFKGLLALGSLTPYAKLIKQELEQNKTAVNGLTFGFTIAGYSFGALLQKYGALVAMLGSRSTIATPERTAATISRLKPGLISATPLDFMIWMEIIRNDHLGQFDEVCDKLKFLLSTAEPCASSRMQQIEKCFGINHINTYATVDGFATIPCPCGEMHLLESIYHVGLYDHNMKYTGNRGTGRLCFTNRIRKSTPMVKFLLDDLVTITDSNCSYGYKAAIKPHGRYELSLELNGKTMGNIDFEEIVYRFGLFTDYRIYVNQDSILIDLEEYPIAKDSYDLAGLKNCITEMTSLKCEIKLHPLGTLTDYRKVRENKSIIKVLDKRKDSRQLFPEIL